MSELPGDIITYGLDLSLSSTGFASKINDKVSFETIRTVPKNFKDDLERIGHICDTIKCKISLQPSLVCIEDFFIPSGREQVNAAIALAGLGMYVRKTLYDLKYPLFIVPPTSLKKFGTGNGKCQKNLVLMEVFKKYNIECKDDNQADAVVLAHLAECIYKKCKELDVSSYKKYEMETVKSIFSNPKKYNF